MSWLFLPLLLALIGLGLLALWLDDRLGRYGQNVRRSFWQRLIGSTMVSMALVGVAVAIGDLYVSRHVLVGSGIHHAATVVDGALFGALLLIMPILDRSGSYGGDMWVPPVRVLGLEIVAFSAVALVPAFCTTGIADAALLGLLILRVASFRLSYVGDFKHVLLLAVVGVFRCVAGVRWSDLEFASGDVGGVPLWAPLLLANAAFLLRRVATVHYFYGLSTRRQPTGDPA